MFSKTLGQKLVRLPETLHRMLAFYVGKASWQQCTKGTVYAGDDYPAADFWRWSLTAEILKTIYGHHALRILNKVSDDTPFPPKICVSAGLETLLQFPEPW